MTHYYEQDGITIHCGDCRDVLPTLPAASFDLTFTSPPYNLANPPWPALGNWQPGDSPNGKSKWRNGSDGAGGIRYGGYGDNLPHAEYVAWQQEILTLCWERTSESGAIYYNHKPRSIGGKLWLPLELNPGLPLRQIVVWARAGGVNFTTTAYVPTHEWIMVFAKPAFRLRDQRASGVGDVWRVPQEANPLHPAPFPVGLPQTAIETTASRTVLDPFCGIGSTLRAAKDAGCQAVGIEISEAYCEVAAHRLEQGVLAFGDD